MNIGIFPRNEYRDYPRDYERRDYPMDYAPVGRRNLDYPILLDYAEERKFIFLRPV